MYRAMLVRANGQLAAKLLAVNDDGRFCGFARHHWFRVWVVDHDFKLPNVAALHRSGSLLLRITPTVFDLDKSGMRCNLPVKECLNLAVVASRVKALVTLHVAEERGIVSTATGASDASSGGGVEGGVFAVERRIRERQVEVDLNPRGKMLGGE